jgi:hypothetical protein
MVRTMANLGMNGHTSKARNGKAAAPPPAHLAEKSAGSVVHLKREEYAPKVIAIPMTVEQLSPLVVNNFSAKVQQQMLDAQMGKAKPKKAPKDPAACFEASKYLDAKGRDCFPIGGLRNSMISAARGSDFKMTELKQAIFIEGPDGPSQTLLPIKFGRCEMGQDPVRNSSGVADIRFRAYYHDWSLSFTLHVMENVVSVVQAYQLLELAGFTVGIGEWRPAGKTGMGGPYGRFRIKASK